MSQPRVFVTGIGVVTALGDSAAALAASLRVGRSALVVEQPPVENGQADAAEASTLPPLASGRLRDFDAKAALPDGNLRPLDRTAVLAAAAARRALESAAWENGDSRCDLGLVLGTTFGSVRTIAGFDHRAVTAGPVYAKPMDFANSVINAAAGQTAIWHDLRGVNATVSGGPASGLQALSLAADQIRAGRARAMLAGGADEACFESLYGFYRLGVLANGGRPDPRPFDRRRQGFALGEAAALLLLESEESARSRGATPLAEVRGGATRFDASRGTQPGRSGRALAAAVRGALFRSSLDARAVDAVSSGASGSRRGDLEEALGLREALDSRAARVPVTAVKSMLGETLGASGALQTVALIEAMRGGVLPAIRGLEQPDPEIPLGALVASPWSLDLGAGLVTALGLRGKASALVVTRPPHGDGR